MDKKKDCNVVQVTYFSSRSEQLGLFDYFNVFYYASSPVFLPVSSYQSVAFES